MGIFFSSFNGLEPLLRFSNFSDHWKEYRFDNVCKINPYTDELPREFYYIDLECVESGQITSALPLLHKENAPSRAQRLLKKDDILYQMVRPYQKNNYYFSKLRSKPTVASTGYAQLRCDKNCSRFIYQLLHTEKLVLNAMRRSTGTGYPAVNSSDLAEIKIALPSLPEQEKIAAFLSLVDARIEKQRQLVESLKKYKRGLLFAIFDRKIRFKDDNGTNFPDWEFKTVADVFKITRGYVLPATDTLDAPTKDFCYPVYSSQTKNYGLLGYYNQYLYSDAITWTTDGANAGYVKFRKDKFYCTNVCGVLISDKGMANSYIAEKLNSITKRHVSYVGNPKLMNNVMAEITIEFPSIKEQQKLSGYIDNIEYLINMNNELLEKLNFYKRGLLQQMFI